MSLLQQIAAGCGRAVQLQLLHVSAPVSAELQQHLRKWPSQLQCWHQQQQQLLLLPSLGGLCQQTRCLSSSSFDHNSSAVHDSSSSSRRGRSSQLATYRHQHSSRHVPELHGTTVLCVRKDNQVVLIADGQITSGPKVVKPNARKLRRLATEPQPSLGGFAGSTADGLTLFERLEQRLEEHPGQLRRAAVELAKVWRQDRVLRHLQAVMIVADASTCLEVSGKGELLEPSDGVHAIGSGARFAVAAARALINTPLPPLEIAQRAMAISAARCIYTNSNWVWEVITADGRLEGGSSVTFNSRSTTSSSSKSVAGSAAESTGASSSSSSSSSSDADSS